MPRYRIHRMKDGPRESFRWAPHTSGLAVVHSKDYKPGEDIEAGNPYQIWKALLSEGRPLRPGDLLESLASAGHPPAGTAELLIAKYIGFEPARWFVPEPKSSDVWIQPEASSAPPQEPEGPLS